MTCKHLFKAVALALSLAVGAAPALAKNFTELKAAASPAGGAWYVGMGAMGKAISTMYPELDVSLFPGGGLANVMHVEKGASDFGIAAHSVIFAAAKGIDPYKKPTENVMGLLNLHDSTRMHFIVNKASGITSLAQIKEKKMPIRISMSHTAGNSYLFGKWILEEYGISQQDTFRLFKAGLPAVSIRIALIKKASQRPLFFQWPYNSRARLYIDVFKCNCMHIRHQKAGSESYQRRMPL